MTDTPQQTSEADMLKELVAAIQDCDRVMVDKLNAIGCMDTHKFSGDDARTLLARAEKAEVEKARLSIDHMNKTRDIRAERDALQADNDRLRAVMQSIADNTCCDGCREAGRVAQSVLKGEPSD